MLFNFCWLPSLPAAGFRVLGGGDRRRRRPEDQAAAPQTQPFKGLNVESNEYVRLDELVTKVSFTVASCNRFLLAIIVCATGAPMERLLTDTKRNPNTFRLSSAGPPDRERSTNGHHDGSLYRKIALVSCPPLHFQKVPLRTGRWQKEQQLPHTVAYTSPHRVAGDVVHMHGADSDCLAYQRMK